MTPKLISKSVSSSPRYQRGLAMLEATIVLPLLFLLALGGAEFGRMLEQYNVLNKQQQDGARYLSAQSIAGTTGIIVLDFSTGATAWQARNLVVYGNVAGTGDPLLEGLDVSDVTITALPGHIQVAVEYDYIPIFSAIIPLDFPLRSSVVMRVVG